MKKFFTLFSASLLFSSLFSQTAVTIGPYLQSPTSGSIKIMWRTDSLCTAKVVFGTDLATLNQTAIDTAFGTRHTVFLSGLSPLTKYFYAIYNDSVFAEGADSVHWFRTFPAAGNNIPFRAWAIGDFGKGNDSERKVRDSYVNSGMPADVWLWLGDNAYSDGTEAEYLTKVFDTVNGYGNVMKNLPFLPCPGNHDYNSVSPVANPQPPLTHTGPYYDLVDVYTQAEAGGVATGFELFYSFNYSNVHFISLNSELGSLGNANDDWTGVNLFTPFTSSPMTQWLHQDLQANTKPWVVVYFHQPPHTDGSHESTAFWEVYMKAMREHFVPICEQYGVDIVLCGHSHVYERSYLAKGLHGDLSTYQPSMILQNRSGVDSAGEAYIKYTQGFNANQGTVYVVNGNSGSNESAPGFTHPYMYAEYGCDSCIGSFFLEVDSNRLDGKHLDAYGNMRDHFTIYKINGANPNSIEEVNADARKLKVAPNPFSASTTVSFELKKTESIKIELSDGTGKRIEVYKGEMNKGAHHIDINAQKLKLAKGIYTMQLSFGSENISKSLIVQ